MTEPEWLACKAPTELFEARACAISLRKVGLYLIASHRHMCFDGQRPWITLDSLERAAEGLANSDVDPASLGIAYTFSSTLPRAQLAIIFRDIFANPFRRVIVDPVWLTSTVIALATGIYDDAAFDRMPILADALQDAGCENDDILNHCRGAGPHVRGCWVVDAILGKA